MRNNIIYPLIIHRHWTSWWVVGVVFVVVVVIIICRCLTLCSMPCAMGATGERERSAKSGYCLIKSIQRDLMALTKPASYDMIVINESAFIASILSHSLWARCNDNGCDYQRKKEHWKKIAQSKTKRSKCTIANLHTSTGGGKKIWILKQYARFMHTMSSHLK